jgi:two-component system nitrogen regulation response regulator NtrX
MISGEGSAQEAFQATQMGAFDYIEKPFGEERLLVSVGRCLDFNRVQLEAKLLAQKAQGGELLGEHPSILQVQKLINRVAPTSGRVLITGESGTGKELVARSIHRQSARSDKPLLKVICSAIAP